MQISRKLYTFAFVADQFAKTSDIAQGLLPLFAPLIGKRAGKPFSPDEFVADVKDTFDMTMHPYVAEELSHRLAAAGYLVSKRRNDSHVEYENKTIDMPAPPIEEAEVRRIVSAFRDFATQHFQANNIAHDADKLEGALFDRLARQDFLALILKPDSTTPNPRTLTLSRGGASELDESRQIERHLDYLVARFILRLAEGNNPDFDLLVSVTSGVLLAEVVFDLQDPRSSTAPLANLRIAVDSPLILGALGLGHDGTTNYSEQLLACILKAGAKPVAFEYTIAEVEHAIRAPIQNYERGQEVYGVLGRKLLTNRNYAAYLRAILPRLREETAKLGVEVVEYTSIDRARDRVKFTEVNENRLAENIGVYERYEAKEHDARAISDVLRLRGGLTATKLADAGIIFVTRNGRLARLSRRFLVENALCAKEYFPPCITDRLLAGLLWIWAGGGGENLPRMRLVANCTSAVMPRRDVVTKMHEFMKNLDQRMMERFDALMTNERAENFLMDRTMGDVRLVTPQNFEEIYREVEEIAAERVAEKKDAEIKKLRIDFESKISQQKAEAAVRDRAQLEENISLGTALSQEMARAKEREGQVQSLERQLAEREVRLVRSFRDAGQRTSRKIWAAVLLLNALAGATVTMVSPAGVWARLCFGLITFLVTAGAALLGNRLFPNNRFEKFIDERRDKAAWRLAEETDSQELLARYSINWQTGKISRVE